MGGGDGKPGSSTKRRILIVDDHPIVRQGLARLIQHEPDIEICGGAEDLASGLRQFEAVQPDLVVIDVGLKDSLGLDLIARIRDRDPRVAILVWSMFDEVVFAERALRAGAQGYVSKQEPIETVVAAIRRVLAGEIHLSPLAAERLMRRVGRAGQPVLHGWIEKLTNRELEVLEMISRGMTTQKIAHTLGLSVKTVESHRENMKSKLNIRNSVELARRAVEWFLERR